MRIYNPWGWGLFAVVKKITNHPWLPVRHQGSNGGKLVIFPHLASAFITDGVTYGDKSAKQEHMAAFKPLHY